MDESCNDEDVEARQLYEGEPTDEWHRFVYVRIFEENASVAQISVPVTLNRKVMSDFTLSDGTFLPKGTFISANVAGTHYDDAYYPMRTSLMALGFPRCERKMQRRA